MLKKTGTRVLGVPRQHTTGTPIQVSYLTVRSETLFRVEKIIVGSSRCPRDDPETKPFCLSLPWHPGRAGGGVLDKLIF